MKPNDVVMMMPVTDLVLALDSSVDFGCWDFEDDNVCTCCHSTNTVAEARANGLGEDASDWIRLWEWKNGESDGDFIDSIVTDGIVAPVVVRLIDGFEGVQWQLGNGNHRVAVALKHDPFGEIPVLFSDNDYMREDVSEDWEYPTSH